MTDAWIISAVRTPVAKRGGGLANLQAWQLASALIPSLLDSTGVRSEQIDHVLMANALYGGGNPTRLAALDAGLPESVPAVTLDSQCCGGMDAIALATQIIRSGSADIIIAGGLESWSRAPKRTSNPVTGSAESYERPPFSPWPDRDPDMLDAAAKLAQVRGASRQQQEQYAIQSHSKACACPEQPGLVPIANQSKDDYTRTLNERLCLRLHPVAGSDPYTLNAATIASQADAAALVLMVNDQVLHRLRHQHSAIRIRATRSGGADPAQPALAPIDVAKHLLKAQAVTPQQLHSVHLMEAFAVQAMVFIEDLGLDALKTNPSGGALSRGHPIGASGAIEVVDAFHTLQCAPESALSLCAIAAAGGLGSCMLLERS